MDNLDITVSKEYYESAITKQMKKRFYPSKTREEAIQYIEKFYPWMKVAQEA